MTSTLAGPTRAAPGRDPAPAPVDPAAPTGGAPSLGLVALVLGIAGTVLGVTIVWFFAAIPLGLAAVVLAVVAMRREQAERHRTRAVLGGVLGLVALLLGVLGAVFLPPILHRADVALTHAETDVTSDINRVDSSVSQDVNRLDATMSRDLRRLERKNHDDLLQLERTTGDSLTRLEQRINATESNFTAQEKADLTRLEQQLRADLHALEQSLRGADSVMTDQIAAIEARVRALEVRLGL